MRKFTRFAGLDPDSPEATQFVAIEDWLNDGVTLALPVARECFAGWYGANSTAKGDWMVAGRAIRPEAFRKPALLILPQNDRLVPPASAAALADRLPEARRLTPPLGHIGMIVGGQAPTEVWEPLAAWLGDLR
jgi:polyhydroxyalkanoate synthase